MNKIISALINKQFPRPDSISLDQFAAMIPENGPMKLKQLRRMQPPAGDVYDKELLDLRCRNAADWLRGYGHALFDLGQLTARQIDSIDEQILELEEASR